MLNDTASTNILTFKNVTKVFVHEHETALDNLSFEVAQGEFVCLIGPSGCGKTTALKIIARLEEPTSGQITRPDHVAMAFQSGALFPWLTVFENVAFGLRALKKSETFVTREVDHYLAMMKLHQFRDKFPSDLSGGQRQRVGIARALAIDPKVLLLDEPFSALDAKTTAELHDDMITVWRETKKTIVMVSHIIEEAISLGDRVILMKEGKVFKEYRINLPYPRRDQAAEFSRHVLEIRHDFFT